MRFPATRATKPDQSLVVNADHPAAGAGEPLEFRLDSPPANRLSRPGAGAANAFIQVLHWQQQQSFPPATVTPT